MITRLEIITPIVKLNLKLKASLYDYSDTYILVKGTISVKNAPAAGAAANNNDKEVVF